MAAETNEAFLAILQEKSRQLLLGHETGKTHADASLRPDGLLFAGMGGSGATAHLIRDACTRSMDLPFTIVQHYQIPHHVKPGWHTLALSYSGNTEETLSVARAAKQRGVSITGFTTGGALAGLADAIVPQVPGYQPRQALGHAWFSVLGYLEYSGLLNEAVPVGDAVAAVDAVDAACAPEVPEDRNEAKQVARRLVEKIPQIYATPAFQGSAHYLRCMLNENAKKIAGVELIPECNHNDLMGWGGDPNRDHFTVLVLSHGDQNPEIQKRIAFMRDWYRAHGVAWHHHEFAPVHSFAEHVVEQARAVQFADYVSYYVAQMRGVDPVEIKAITALKDALRQG